MTAMNKQSIYGLLNDSEGFLITNKYTQTSAKCKIFWKELSYFAFHNKNNHGEFDDFYNSFIVGSIITVENDDNLSQLIFGQDQFITIILLLVAIRENLRFHERFGDPKIRDTCFTIDRLIHGLTRCGKIDADNLMFSIQDDISGSDLKQILLTKKVPENATSLYAQNYQFFQNKLYRLSVNQRCSLPNIILYKVLLLHIEADSKEDGIDILEQIKKMK